MTNLVSDIDKMKRDLYLLLQGPQRSYRPEVKNLSRQDRQA